MNEWEGLAAEELEPCYLHEAGTQPLIKKLVITIVSIISVNLFDM